jgi:hypothetical protein
MGKSQDLFRQVALEASEQMDTEISFSLALLEDIVEATKVVWTMKAETIAVGASLSRVTDHLETQKREEHLQTHAQIRTLPMTPEQTKKGFTIWIGCEPAQSCWSSSCTVLLAHMGL